MRVLAVLSLSFVCFAIVYGQVGSPEGGPCGSLTKMLYAPVCACGLYCEFPPNMRDDIPGVCRTPCASEADCSESQYCVSSWTGQRVCRALGTCGVLEDCFHSENEWAIPTDPSQVRCELGVCTQLSDNYNPYH